MNPSHPNAFPAALFLAMILSGQAEDQTQPTIQSMIGGVLFDGDHIYVAETEVGLPLYREEPFSLYYRHYEITPVFREGAQTQLLYARNELEADVALAERVRGILVGGYRSSLLEDRAGSLSGYTVGVGVGSAIQAELPRLEWSVTAGSFLSTQRLDADWWADAHLAWRIWEFGQATMMESLVRPSLKLSVDIESANDGARFDALYKIGPVLEMMSGNGNRVLFQARWFANDGNPFLETDYSGMLLGAEIRSSFDPKNTFDARTHRPSGWLPLVWGAYDVGYGGDRTTQKTELFAELHDLVLANQMITGVLWYESRQEYRPGDYDNISYSVSIGAQTRLGLASVLSQGKPLVLGAEYVHRSAHALAPDEDRVPPPEVLPHNSLNLGPRVRLQTLGWDLPYRDPAIYDIQNAWLNDFDWRLTLGYDFHHSRNRDNPAAQVGLNWDAATVWGTVLYARGLLSAGNETPDWQAEVGVRRRRMKVFFRYDDYGLENHLAEGKTAVAGMAIHL